MRRFGSRLFLAIGFAACFAMVACTGHGHVRVTGEARTAPPTLVYLGPGVWVVEDYDRPVFYSDGYYWLYDDGYWYRSGGVYSDSWVRVRVGIVPRPVRRIDRPRRYIRYHARGNARTRRGPVRVRDHRDRPNVRHRKNERVPARRSRDHRRAKPPVEKRDHRRAKPPAKRRAKPPAKRAKPPAKRDHRRARPPAKKRDHRGKPPVKKRDHRDDD